MEDIRYGHIGGGRQHLAEMGIAGSEVFYNLSGHFVKNNGSDYLTKMGDTDTAMLGWAEIEEKTCSATDGGDSAIVICDPTAVFRLPLRYESATYTVNYSASLIGKCCDLVVVSNIQYANLTDSDEDTIFIVGGKAATATGKDDGYVDVMLNIAKLFSNGVA